jgi:hypothetical protein
MIKPYTLNVLRRDGVTTVELFEEREAAHAAAINLIGDRTVAYASVTDERNGVDPFEVNNAKTNIEV